MKTTPLPNNAVRVETITRGKGVIIQDLTLDEACELHDLLSDHIWKSGRWREAA